MRLFLVVVILLLVELNTFSISRANAASFKGAAFSKSGSGIAITSGGLIYKTIDKGLNWKKLATVVPIRDSSGKLRCDGLVKVINVTSNIYIVSGYRRFVARTFDAGQSWTVTHIDPKGYHYFVSMSFFDPASGLAISDDGSILSTIDSGLSWKDVGGIAGEKLRSANFLNSSKGVAINENEITLTRNGGVSWEQSRFDRGIRQIGLYDIAHSGNTFLSVGGEYLRAADATLGLFMRSTDGGQTWDSKVTDHFLPLVGVASLDSVAIAVGIKGTIARTEDSGLHWSAISSPVQSDLKYVCVLDNHCACVLTDEVILYTTDGGTTWNKSNITE